MIGEYPIHFILGDIKIDDVTEGQILFGKDKSFSYWRTRKFEGSDGNPICIRNWAFDVDSSLSFAFWDEAIFRGHIENVVGPMHGSEEIAKTLQTVKKVIEDRDSELPHYYTNRWQWQWPNDVWQTAVTQYGVEEHSCSQIFAPVLDQMISACENAEGQISTTLIAAPPDHE